MPALAIELLGGAAVSVLMAAGAVALDRVVIARVLVLLFNLLALAMLALLARAALAEFLGTAS